MDPLTIQYRLDLPSALHPISPALSALHTSRAAALHPELAALLRPTHCLKCGAHRYDAPSTKKNRTRAKSRCRLCRTLNHSVPAQSAKTVSVTPASQEPAESHHQIAQTNASATRAPVAPSPGQRSHPKSGHPSLRDMLSRNRQSEVHKKSKEGHDGLAAFLKEL